MVTLRGSTAKQVLSLVEDRDFRANVTVGNQSGASIFNHLEPPVDDIRVRSALILMSDAEDVARILGDDGLVPNTDGFFEPESGWYSEAAGRAYLSRDGTDPERAAALIEEYVNDPNRTDGKGVGEPIEVEYACPPDPSLIEIGQYVQRQWSSIGVEVRLRQVEQAALVQNAIGSADQDPPWRGNFMISCWRAGAGEGDPLTALTSFFDDPSTNPLNFTNFSHPEIDEALETLKVNADFEVRYQAVETINRIANENAVLTWSIATPTLVGWRGDVFGLTTWVLPDGRLGNRTPGGHMHFSQVFLRR
jgi:peptide/nickel transport system substrate-binding protein